MSSHLAIGSSKAVETSVRIVHADKESCTVEVEGTYAVVSTLTPANYCPSGYVVESSQILTTGNAMGKLVVNGIKYDTGADFSAIRTTFRVSMEAVQYDLEDHPHLANSRDEILMWLATDESKRIDGSDYKYEDKDGTLSNVDATTEKFCDAYMAGIRTFNRYFPVIEKISIWKNPPGLNRNGRSFSSGSPTFSSNAGKFDTPPITLNGFASTNFYKSVEWESPETTNWIEHAGGKSSFPILHVTSDNSGGYCGGGGTTNLFHAIATPQTFVSSALYEAGLDGVTPEEAGIDPEDPVICIAVPTNCVTMNPSYRGQYAALDVYSTYKLYLGPEAEEEYYYDDCSTLIEHYQGGTNSFCVKAPLTLRFSRSYSYMRPVEHFAPKIGALNGNGPHVKEMNAAFLSSIVVASDWPNMHPVQIITPSSSRWQFFNSNLYGYDSNTTVVNPPWPTTNDFTTATNRMEATLKDYVDSEIVGAGLVTPQTVTNIVDRGFFEDRGIEVPSATKATVAESLHCSTNSVSRRMSSYSTIFFDELGNLIFLNAHKNLVAIGSTWVTQTSTVTPDGSPFATSNMVECVVVAATNAAKSYADARFAPTSTAVTVASHTSQLSQLSQSVASASADAAEANLYSSGIYSYMKEQGIEVGTSILNAVRETALAAVNAEAEQAA